MRSIGIGVALVVATGMASVASCSSSNGGGNNGSVDSGPKPVLDSGVEEAGDDSGDADLLPTPPAWNVPITQPSDTTAQAGRAACMYARGAMPASTLGASTPLAGNIPIENIVVIMMENRSFDSMLGHMNEAESRTDVAEPPAGASNPNVPGGDAGVNPYTHAPHLCFADTDHSWHGQHQSWDNGANDGFFFTNNLHDDNGIPVDAGEDASDDAGVAAAYDGERAMWWYDDTDVPFEYSLANSYAFADNYFCSTLGPTYPNRDYLVSGTSFGVTENTFPTVSDNIPDNVVITDELEQRHTSWGLYTDGTPGLATVLQIGLVTRYENYTSNIRYAISDFLTAAKNGTMPQVSFVDPNLGSADSTVTNNDQHPPSDVQIGSAFLQEIVSAVTTSPQWAHTALFITWDENGGEYDHVPPPKACAPDSIPPSLAGTDVGTVGDFTQYGFRVPLIVVSPYAKKGYVGHTAYDHTSITRFIEAKFQIPAMSGRDANADPLMDLFDFSSPALLTPPTLATPIEDDAGLGYCVGIYNDGLFGL